MPSKSKKQHNLMALVANDPKAAKRLGIPQSVGRDFMKADKGHKFNSGGFMKYRMRPMARGEMEMPMRRRGGAPMTMRKGGKAESPEMVRKEIAFMKKKGAPKSMVRHEEEEIRGGGKGRVKKFANGRLVPNPNVANPNARVVPGIGTGPFGVGGGYRGSYQTPIEMQELERIARYQEMSPHTYEKFANKIITAGRDAPKAIAEAAKAAGRSGMIKGGIGGTALGALGTAYGPSIMSYFQSLGGRPKPTVTATDMEGKPLPKARGGKIQSHKASKGPFRHAADGVAHKGKTKGRVVKMREGGMAYSEGGSVYRRAADGIASKGKTKGHMVKMRYGGKC